MAGNILTNKNIWAGTKTDAVLTWTKAEGRVGAGKFFSSWIQRYLLNNTQYTPVNLAVAAEMIKLDKKSNQW